MNHSRTGLCPVNLMIATRVADAYSACPRRMIGFLARRFGWEMLIEPLFNFVSLRRPHDAVPFHHSGQLTVFGHDVGGIVEDLDNGCGL